MARGPAETGSAGRARHVALFTSSLGGGGAERALVTIANSFARRGVRTDLVLADAAGPLRGFVEDGVRIVDLQGGRVLRSLPALLRYLGSEKPDAVISTLAAANAVAMLAMRIRRNGPPLIVREANTPSVMDRQVRIRRHRLIPLFYRLFRGQIRKVVAVSTGVADDMATFYGIDETRIEVIRNPVVTRDFPRLAGEDPGHRWLAAGSPKVVLGVGRLDAQKNFPLLIEAFARLSDREDRRLIILGEGSERRNLERLRDDLGLADQVDLPGFVDNPIAFLARADVFALSSNYEGLPATLIQALACGCAVVSTDCPSGPAEILRDGALGTLVPVGDREAMTGALENAFRAGRSAPPEEELREYAEDTVAERYLAVVEEVVSRGGTTSPVAEPHPVGERKGSD